MQQAEMEIQFCSQRPVLVPGLAGVRLQAELVHAGLHHVLGAWLKKKARFLLGSKLDREAEQPTIR